MSGFTLCSSTPSERVFAHRWSSLFALGRVWLPELGLRRRCDRGRRVDGLHPDALLCPGCVLELAFLCAIWIIRPSSFACAWAGSTCTSWASCPYWDSPARTLGRSSQTR